MKNQVPSPMSRAFSLLELLVLVATISILSAIIFPALNQVRLYSKAMTCLLNNKTLGSAWQLYSNDNDDVMCPYGYDDGIGGLGFHQAKHYFAWDGGYDLQTLKWEPALGLLHPYCKSATSFIEPLQVTEIPSIELWEQGRYSVVPWSGHWDVPRRKIGLNSLLRGSASDMNILVSQVSVPTETILLADSANVSYNANTLHQCPLATACTEPQANISTCLASTVGRHNQRANVEWLDGHASQVLVQPQSWNWGTQVSAESSKAESVGYIVKPGCNVSDAKCMNYLYALSGPVSADPDALTK